MTYDSNNYPYIPGLDPHCPTNQTVYRLHYHEIKNSYGNKIASILYIIDYKYDMQDWSNTIRYQLRIILYPTDIKDIKSFKIYNGSNHPVNSVFPITVNGKQYMIRSDSEMTFYDNKIDITMGQYQTQQYFSWPRIVFDYDEIPISDPPKIQDFNIQENTWFMRKDGVIQSEVLGLEYSVDQIQWLDFSNIVYLKVGTYHFRMKATAENKESSSIEIQIPYIPYSKQLYDQIIQVIRQYLD